MQSLILLLFVGWSVTTILVNGTIFKPLRDYLIVTSPFFGQLISCVMCTGLWIGVMISLPLLSAGWMNPVFPDMPIFISYLSYPFLQSGFGILIESLIIYFVKGSNSRI